MTGSKASTGGMHQDVLQRFAARYPREVTLSDNRRVTLALMGEKDIDAVLDFARTLPPDDLMFLQVNITERPVVQYWVESITAGRMITVLAKRNTTVLGEATLRHNEASWTRHLGELRIQIAQVARRGGLARLLATEIETVAKQLGQLGFQREAVLWDYVVTPDGTTRNVLIATKRL